MIERTDREHAIDDVTVKPFPGSRKVYVEGSRPDLRVPMRAVDQDPTASSGDREENPTVWLYDTSGPYTDPEAAIDLRGGGPSPRERWIEERGDTERLDGPSSGWARDRAADPAFRELRFPEPRAPRRARPAPLVARLTTDTITTGQLRRYLLTFPPVLRIPSRGDAHPAEDGE